MLDRYRHEAGREAETSALSGLPVPWCGLLRKTETGHIVTAGRFFKRRRWLLEINVVWPALRDLTVETELMRRVHVEDAQAPQRLWQAMGLRVHAPRDYDLESYSAEVGRIAWTFRTDQRRSPAVTVERIALVKHWLKGTPADWLPQQLEDRRRAVRADRLTVNDHPAFGQLARLPAAPWRRLIGRHRHRADIAWVCPEEQRLYHVLATPVTAAEIPAPPGGFQVDCCRSDETAYGTPDER
jgi:hypothetical protein